MVNPPLPQLIVSGKRALTVMATLVTIIIPSIACQSETDLAPCDLSQLSPGTHDCGFMFNDLNRAYRVFLPEPATGNPKPINPKPIVFDFHGDLQTAIAQSTASRFIPIAEQYDFIVVWPEARFLRWNKSDEAFQAALLEHIATEQAIDMSRVYATGLSRGGYFTNDLGCLFSTTYAAIAPVSATLFDLSLPKNQQIPSCTPLMPIPIMYTHAFNDLIIDYNGSTIRGTLSAPDTFEKWAEINQCAGTAVLVTEVGNTFCQEYQTCASDVTVKFCGIDAPFAPLIGGHIPYNTLDINLSETIWQFFDKHSR